jgi:hypothetical protein
MCEPDGVQKQDVLIGAVGTFLLAACNASRGPSDEADTASWRGVDEPEDAEVEPAWQELVDPEDDPEPSDASVLHVPVEPSHRHFVLNAANALLASGGGKDGADPIESLAVAQELMALVARADALALASAAVGEDIEGETGAPVREVVFTTITVLRGEAPPALTTTMRAEGSAAGCGPKAPPTGSQHLVFFDLNGDAPRLLSERGASRIVDGIVLGWPGLAASVEQIQNAAAAAQEGVP